MVSEDEVTVSRGHKICAGATTLSLAAAFALAVVFGREARKGPSDSVSLTYNFSAVIAGWLLFSFMGSLVYLGVAIGKGADLDDTGRMYRLDFSENFPRKLFLGTLIVGTIGALWLLVTGIRHDDPWHCLNPQMLLESCYAIADCSESLPGNTSICTTVGQYFPSDDDDSSAVRGLLSRCWMATKPGVGRMCAQRYSDASRALQHERDVDKLIVPIIMAMTLFVPLFVLASRIIFDRYGHPRCLRRRAASRDLLGTQERAAYGDEAADDVEMQQLQQEQEQEQQLAI